MSSADRRIPPQDRLSRLGQYPGTASTASALIEELTEPATPTHFAAATQWMMRGSTLEEDLVACEQAGLHGIGLNSLKVDEAGRSKAVELLAASPLEVTSFDWIANFTGYNQYSRDETCHEAMRMIRLADRMGARSVTVLTGPRHNHGQRHCESLVVDSLRWLADVAVDVGVDLALLPMNDDCTDEWTFLNSIPYTLELIERIECPRVGMLLHTFHMAKQPGLPTLLADPAVTDAIKLVRLSDWDRGCSHENDQRFPGKGQLPLPALLGSLQRAGYRGYYEVDVWSARTWDRQTPDMLGDVVQFARSHVPAPNFSAATSASVRSEAESTFEAVLRPV